MTTARTAAWLIPAMLWPITTALTICLLFLMRLTARTTTEVIRTEIRIWRWRRKHAQLADAT